MKIMVISDFFCDVTTESWDKITCINWNNYRALSLRGIDALILDLTFENNESETSRTKMLFQLKTRFEDIDFLKRNNLILVVVCGTGDDDLEYEEPYDDNFPNRDYEQKPFNVYSFLKAILPDKEKLQAIYDEDLYPVVSNTITLYLNRYKTEKYYICYDYISDSASSLGITPFAKMKEDGNSLVAFECVIGKCIAVILPPYSMNDKGKAYSLLLKICRGYFKQREGMKDMLGAGIPENIRDDFNEALACFNHDYYKAALVMCRRAIEGSAISFGITFEKNERLKDIIEKMCKDGIIDQKIRKLADLVRFFGNLGAHFEKHEGVEISEADALSALNFTRIFFENAHCLPDQILKAEKRLKELNKGGY